MFTRREFTSGLAGTAAAVALGAHAEGKEPKIKRSVVRGLEIGVQSYTYRELSLERMIDSMRSVGLSSLELWTGHLDPEKHGEADFTSTRKKLEAAGIRVNAYCVNFRPDASAALLDKAFRGARLLGTSILTTSTEKSIVPRLDTWCAKYGVTLGLHNHWLGDAWFRGDKAQNFEGPADYAEALAGRSKRIAINLDIGHFAAAGHDPVAFFREHHQRIVSLHVKDRDKDEARSHVRFGKGATPISDVLMLARKLKFKHAANLEYEIEAGDPTEGVRHAFAYVKAVLH
jgi:sugar phosphate isomerase/epimerase